MVATMPITVTDVIIYPVKSCKGIPLDSAAITATGFAFDRRWVIVNDKRKFITQRQDARLTHIQTSLPEAALQSKSTSSMTSNDCLTLNAPGVQPLHIPLTLAKLNLVECTVWTWVGKAHDEGDAAADWLTRYLGRAARLMRYAGDNLGSEVESTDGTHRVAGPHDKSRWTVPAYNIMFSDQFPFLVTTQASLAALNVLVARQSTSGGAGKVPMDRFRPNIVLQGTEAFEEDGWTSVQLGNGTVLQIVKPCSRCKIPSIDQATGVEGDEPGHTLAALRSGAALGWVHPPSMKAAMFFGVHAACEAASAGGRIAVGEPVHVLRRWEGPPQPVEG